MFLFFISRTKQNNLICSCKITVLIVLFPMLLLLSPHPETLGPNACSTAKMTQKRVLSCPDGHSGPPVSSVVLRSAVKAAGNQLWAERGPSHSDGSAVKTCFHAASSPSTPAPSPPLHNHIGSLGPAWVRGPQSSSFKPLMWLF